MTTETQDDTEALDEYGFAGTEADLAAQADEAEAEALRLDGLAAAAQQRLDGMRSKELDGVVPQTNGGDSTATETRRRWIRLGVRGLGLLVTAGVLTAALIADGRIWLHHQQSIMDQRRVAEFTAAARQSVVNLTSMDFNHAPDDVQRILDGTTGAFKDEFQRAADEFTKTVQMSKVVTAGTVNGIAVESMTDDSAIVLVSATSEITNATGPRQNPRAWRLSVTLTRDDGVLKMSKVEMVA